MAALSGPEAYRLALAYERACHRANVARLKLLQVKTWLEYEKAEGRGEGVDFIALEAILKDI